MAKERGSALIIVILVVLVLTMVGLASVFYMTVEDRISQSDKLAQSAMHAAEAGLKAGEQIISKYGSRDALSAFMKPTSTPQSADSHNDQPNALSDLMSASHLGSVLYSKGLDSTGSALYDIPVGASGITGLNERFSIYVRNNPSDYQTSDGTNYCVDHDFRINIVSRGVVKDASGREMAVKILSETLFFGEAAVKPAQYRFQQGGTAGTLY